MEILWFGIISVMLTMYVILDGFDLGVGVIHRIIGKTELERGILIKTIGPVWDGNEVWLLAAGGTMYFAFPKLYASSFSGFYLPLMIVLWLLILRAAGIEFRHQIQNPIWKSFWDTVFAIASTLLAIVLGAALGNVIRGVPIDSDGYFFAPLWTTFTTSSEAGILDWFTIIIGIISLTVLTMHGSLYIAMKTEGELQTRSRKVAKLAWWFAFLFSLLGIVGTTYIQPEFWKNYSKFPWGFIFPVIGIAAFMYIYLLIPKKQDTKAFFSSSVFIGSTLVSTAFGLFPYLLRSTIDANNSLTVYNSITKEYGLQVGLIWWILGIILTTVYFIYVYRSFKGKVTSSSETGY